MKAVLRLTQVSLALCVLASVSYLATIRELPRTVHDVAGCIAAVAILIAFPSAHELNRRTRLVNKGNRRA